MENNWNIENVDEFWTRSPEHVVQVYEEQVVLLDTLAGFVGGGIRHGECVIVIATEDHIRLLNERLTSYGISVDTLVADERYIPLDAAGMLRRFMVGDLPDETLFNKVMGEVVARARIKGRRVRAFGEMVVLLWEGGNEEATVELERLWSVFCASQNICLFCAYPQTAFAGEDQTSVHKICSCHSMVLNGSRSQLTEVCYKS